MSISTAAVGETSLPLPSITPTLPLQPESLDEEKRVSGSATPLSTKSDSEGSTSGDTWFAESIFGDSVFEDEKLAKFYEPPDNYESKHRFDPSLRWYVMSRLRFRFTALVVLTEPLCTFFATGRKRRTLELSESAIFGCSHLSASASPLCNSIVPTSPLRSPMTCSRTLAFRPISTTPVSSHFNCTMLMIVL